MTSSAYVCEPCFRARIKNVQNAYQSAYEFFQKFMGEALVSGFETKQLLQQLKFLLLLWLLCQWLCDKISGKILLISQNHFSGVLFFSKKKTKKTKGHWHCHMKVMLVKFLLLFLSKSLIIILSCISWQQ